MPEAAALDRHPAGDSDYGNPDPEWPRIEWRRHLRRVRLRGAEVNYVELGEGAPVLFVHGISGCWQNWLETLPYFCRGRRVVALDLPGCGASPMPDWPIDIPAYGRLLHELCDALDLERPALVGNSLGGFVAAETVTAGPGRFERLALISAAGIVNTWRPEARATALAFAWKAFSPRVAGLAREIVSRPRSRQLALGPFVRYPNRLAAALLWEQIAGGAACPAFGQALHAAISHDIRERLGTIEIPTLVLSGLQDRVIPVNAALSFHRRIPHSRLEIFERTGHLPQLERPRRFNAVLDDFFADPGR